jgi:hypothetical protein
MTEELDPKKIVEEAKAEAEKGDAVSQAQTKAAEPVEETEAPEEIDKPTTQLVAELAQRLIAGNKGIQQCVGTMIASRQLYAMAVKDLELQVRDLPEEDSHELLEECLIQAAGAQAAKPFDENALYVGFQETVYPWMIKTVKRHNEEEEREHKQEMDDLENARRARPLPVGINFDPELEDALPRERGLVLVGWEPALRWVMDQMVTNVLATRDREQLFFVIRLMEAVNKDEEIDEKVQRQLFRLGGKFWKNCCKSNKSWPILFQTKILEHLTDPPDLLVCDNLCSATENIIGAGRSSRAAGHAHKKFRDWCLKAGCGFLGGVPQESKDPPNLGGPEWEQLRTWSCLRPVWVKDSENQVQSYNVCIGRDTVIATVPKSTLDSQGSGKIILPGS